MVGELRGVGCGSAASNEGVEGVGVVVAWYVVLVEMVAV